MGCSLSVPWLDHKRPPPAGSYGLNSWLARSLDLCLPAANNARGALPSQPVEWNVFANARERMDFGRAAVIVLSDNGVHKISHLRANIIYQYSATHKGGGFVAQMAVMDDTKDIVKHRIIGLKPSNDRRGAFVHLKAEVERQFDIIIQCNHKIVSPDDYDEPLARQIRATYSQQSLQPRKQPSKQTSRQSIRPASGAQGASPEKKEVSATITELPFDSQDSIQLVKRSSRQASHQSIPIPEEKEVSSRVTELPFDSQDSIQPAKRSSRLASHQSLPIPEEKEVAQRFSELPFNSRESVLPQQRPAKDTSRPSNLPSSGASLAYHHRPPPRKRSRQSILPALPLSYPPATIPGGNPVPHFINTLPPGRRPPEPRRPLNVRCGHPAELSRLYNIPESEVMAARRGGRTYKLPARHSAWNDPRMRPQKPRPDSWSSPSAHTGLAAPLPSLHPAMALHSSKAPGMNPYLSAPSEPISISRPAPRPPATFTRTAPQPVPQTPLIQHCGRYGTGANRQIDDAITFDPCARHYKSTLDLQSYMNDVYTRSDTKLVRVKPCDPEAPPEAAPKRPPGPGVRAQREHEAADAKRRAMGVKRVHPDEDNWEGFMARMQQRRLQRPG